MMIFRHIRQRYSTNTRGRPVTKVSKRVVRPFICSTNSALREQAHESMLKVRDRYIEYTMGLGLRVIEYGRYYTISYRRHNRRRNLANGGGRGSSPHPGFSLGEPITTIRKNREPRPDSHFGRERKTFSIVFAQRFQSTRL